MSNLEPNIIVSLSSQILECKTLRGTFRYSVSTSLKGPGQILDSGCTPLGRHAIVEKIGAGLPLNTVFVGRRATGELYSDTLGLNNPDRDWILTRILWLTGLDAGFNEGGLLDTKSRFIYIHGCPDFIPIGSPGSAGCIRMRNKDIVDLFEMVAVGTRVEILD